MRDERRQIGFTLVELLVVVSIVVVLIAILLPSLGLAREQARRSVCAGNLHTLGIATVMYLDTNGAMFRYYTTVGGADGVFPGAGRQWWFGFEVGGPGTGMGRPLDKSLSPLAPYTASLSSKMQCPDFPYNEGYFPKFTEHAASYGLNILMAPATGLTATRGKYGDRLQSIFIFADGIQYDFNPGFNEGHYLMYTMPLSASGYAHFRHFKRAQVVCLDGHVDSQVLAGGKYAETAGSAAGNLAAPDGSNSIYGY